MSTVCDLPDLGCPKCGSGDVHLPDAYVSLDVRPDGAWYTRAIGFNDEGDAECNGCGHEGPAKTFKKVSEPTVRSTKAVSAPCGNGCPWPHCLTETGECSHGC